VIHQSLLNFHQTFEILQENFNFNNDFLFATDYSLVLHINDFTNYTFLKLFLNIDFNTKSLITYIDQIEDIALFNNLENVTAVYHYSVPNVKLYYPEPFIASPTFIHNDL
jgi:hypothetical protein